MNIGCVVNLTAGIETSFDEALSVGLHRGQLVVWDMSLYTKENAERILRFCEKENFEITAVWCGWSGPLNWKYPEMYSTLGLVPAYLRWKRTEDILKGAEFARWFGVKDIVTHIGYFPDDPYNRARIEIMQCVRVIAEKLKENGQRFLFETGEELPVTLIGLIEDVGTGNLGVNYDPANLMMGGRANSLDALRMFEGLIWGVHAKDGCYPHKGQRKGVQVPLGEGETQFEKVVGILKEFGYDGCVTIEREISDADRRRQDIADAAAKLKIWMGDAYND